MKICLLDDDRLDLIAEAITLILGRVRQGTMGALDIKRLETISDELCKDADARAARAQAENYESPRV